MSYSDVQLVTGYMRTLWSCVDGLAKEGRVLFTIQEFANGCGFRVTPNLRRRLKNLVKMGVLHETLVYNAGNRLVYQYTIDSNYVEAIKSEIPF